MHPALALAFLLALEPTVPLPKPEGLSMSVGDALARRHSCRSFEPGRKVTRGELATLLWAAAGITRPDPSHPRGGKRTAPSAFGSASIDVWVTSEEGTFLYSPKEHALILQDRADLRGKLAGAAWAREAPLLLVIVADLERYPKDTTSEAERRDYSFADGAAAGENIYLAATALGLGTVLTMCTNPEAAAALKLGTHQKTLYAFAVGKEGPSGK